jgi:RNA polymerase sigma factor (sigma-70 family)
MMPASDNGLESDVRAAQALDHAALTRLLERIQRPVYSLALQMLWHPEDAQDAAQEILIRICEKLPSFRGGSSFRTWAYRVAVNHLKNVRKSRMERQRLTFQSFGEDLLEGLQDAEQPRFEGVDQALLLEEIKLGCTLGMLTCLDRPHRLAYILGEILEVEGPDAAAILEISPTVFRKRLSRARSLLVEFMRRKCGLFDPHNPCRCRRRIARARELGRLTPHQLLFAENADEARRFPEVLVTIRKLESTRRAAALYRSHPGYKSSIDIGNMLKTILT